MKYKGILKENGLVIPEEDALVFALWRVLCKGEDKKQFEFYLKCHVGRGFKGAWESFWWKQCDMS